MMKPSESAAVMQTDARGNPVDVQNMHRNFNQTQHVYSEEKVYPSQRAHTIDAADLDQMHHGMSDLSPTPQKARNLNNYVTEDST